MRQSVRRSLPIRADVLESLLHSTLDHGHWGGAEISFDGGDIVLTYDDLSDDVVVPGGRVPDCMADEVLKPHRVRLPDMRPYVKVGIEEKSKKPYAVIGVQGEF